MKTLLILITATLLISCSKEQICNCTYYSDESTTANPSWKTTYTSKWDGCENADFGTSTYNCQDGTYIKTRTYVKCN